MESFPKLLWVYMWNLFVPALMAVGLAEQPWGSQPTQIASNRNSVHSEEKIFPKAQRLPRFPPKLAKRAGPRLAKAS